jgi:hypothetical protein
VGTPGFRRAWGLLWGASPNWAGSGAGTSTHFGAIHSTMGATPRVWVPRTVTWPLIERSGRVIRRDSTDQFALAALFEPLDGRAEQPPGLDIKMLRIVAVRV